ncbi:rod shape-determining protein MreC [Alicyclobacillus contaminans]|uniref:rod shape-determining protein MreC n=1 Tax=Alicyclobacillus contaminans TaxID=392016 RepID=UPI00047DF355|nr:rod shape-determining protein MreC [Alicyclobacillus contaminans]
MSRLITNRRLFIVLASFILLIVIAGLTIRGRDQHVSWPEKVVMDVENTVGSWIYRPVSQLTAFIGGIHSLHEMYVENAQLKAEMKDYSALNAKLQEVEQQNQRYSQMLGFKQQHVSMNLVPAHVIARNPSTWSNELVIDAGTRDGVKEDMAVIAADGSLVGRVTAAATLSSKVMLVTDTRAGDGVSAKVLNGSSTPPFGMITGSSTVSGKLELSFLSPVEQVKPGQTVVTSGLSTIFPPDLVVGTVTKVIPGLQGLTQSAIVTPAADLDYLQEVFVIRQQSGSTP